jgi:hypothetical protein
MFDTESGVPRRETNLRQAVERGGVTLQAGETKGGACLGTRPIVGVAMPRRLAGTASRPDAGEPAQIPR